MTLPYRQVSMVIDVTAMLLDDALSRGALLEAEVHHAQLLALTHAMLDALDGALDPAWFEPPTGLVP